MTLQERPELRVDGTRLVSTGAIDARHAYTTGLEASGQYGPLFLQGEYERFRIERLTPAAGVSDPEFHGCMFMNTAAEFPNPHDPVHQAAAAHKRRTRNHWRDLARAAGADSAAAETFADCFTALVEGALILRQTHGRNDAARVVRPAVEQLIGAYLPNARKTPARISGVKPRSSVPQAPAES